MSESSSSSDGWKAEKKITVDVQAGDDPEVEIEANTPTDVEYVHFIDRVSFDRQVMSPGGTCEVSVDTVFSSINCPITLTCKDKNGTFKTIKGKMTRRSKSFSIPVPREAEGHVIVEADLEGAKEKVTTDGVVALTKPITVQEIRWSAEETKEGETVTLTAQVSKAANGYPAFIRIQENDPTVPNGGGKTIATFRKTVEGGGVELNWTAAMPIRRDAILTEKEREEERERGTEVPEYEKPSVVAEVEVLGIVGQSWRKPGKPSGKYSGKMAYSDDLTLRVANARTGAPLADQTARLVLPDGSEKEVTLDAKGTATVEDVPPGAATLTLPEYSPASEDDDSGEEASSDAADREPLPDDAARLVMATAEASTTVLTGGEQAVAVVPPRIDLILKQGFIPYTAGTVDYELTVSYEEGEDQTYTGTVGDDGRLSQAVAPGATLAKLVLKADDQSFTLPLSLGGLKPVEETEGVQQRLARLGYYEGKIDGEVGPVTRFALRAFQEEMDEPVTGSITESTRVLLDHLPVPADRS